MRALRAPQPLVTVNCRQSDSATGNRGYIRLQDYQKAKHCGKKLAIPELHFIIDACTQSYYPRGIGQSATSHIESYHPHDGVCTANS